MDAESKLVFPGGRFRSLANAPGGILARGVKGVSGLVLCVALALSTSAIAGNTYTYATVCPKPSGGHMVVDPWLFYKCECTSYAAAKLNQAGIAFSNYYKGVRWGNASNWLAAAKSAKIAYDTNPKVGDIAWFSYGHVARVDAVSSTGAVTISEYNYYINSTPWTYSTRTLRKGTSSFPKYFIHIK